VSQFLANHHDEIVVLVAKHELGDFLMDPALNGIGFSTIEEGADLIKPGDFDVLVNAWSNKILSTDFLRNFKSRVNLHPSLVPWGRGSYAATWAIRDKEPFGVSLIEMTSGIDEGDVFAQEPIDTEAFCSARELADHAKHRLVELFKGFWASNFGIELVATPQIGLGSFHTISETVEDRKRYLREFSSESDLIRWARAHNFLPKSGPSLVVGDHTYSLRLEDPVSIPDEQTVLDTAQFQPSSLFPAFQEDTTANTPSVFAPKDISVNVTPELLQEIQALAGEEFATARLCLHEVGDSRSNLMLLSYAEGVESRVKRHLERNKVYILLRGRLELDFFSDNGDQLQCIALSSHDSIVVTVPALTFHRTRSTSRDTVVVEYLDGPFRGEEQDREYLELSD